MKCRREHHAICMIATKEVLIQTGTATAALLWRLTARANSWTLVGNNLPTQWSITGRLDIQSIGLTLNPQTGELSGTPTKPGEFLLSVGAVTTSVDQQYRNFTLTIKQGGQRGGRPPKN